MNCKQREGETLSTNSERVRRAVRSATIGQSKKTTDETTMDHFIAGLNKKIRLFVQSEQAC